VNDATAADVLDRFYLAEKSAILDRMLDMGVSKYMASLPPLAPVFQTGRVKEGCCSDSRIYLARHRGEKGGYVQGIASLGSLLLLAYKNLERAREFVRRSKIAAIWGHTRCGAGHMLYQKVHGVPPPDQETLDGFVMAQTQKAAELLGVDYGGFIHSGSLRKSPDVHPVRTVAIIGTQACSLWEVDYVPRAFRSFAVYHEEANTHFEVQTLTGIALGPLGYGSRLSASNPVLWMPVGDADNEEQSCEAISERLVRFRRTLSPDLAEKIHIDGFNWSSRRESVV